MARRRGCAALDVANPLDLSAGMPPSLSMVSTDSLGEQIQRSFPAARVVKSPDTVNASVMVDPAQVGAGDHTVFLPGDDPDAKASVEDLLRSFGWTDVIDPGDLSTARGSELLLPLWLRLYGALQTLRLNTKVVR